MKKIAIIVAFVVTLLLNIHVLYADDSQTILKGDADRNGVVNAKDALLVLEIVAHVKEMDNTFSIRQCDLTGDYDIKADDALNILKVSANIIEQETIADPEGIYSSIEYKDGYPVGYGIGPKGNTTDTRIYFQLKSSNYYGVPSAYKFETNAAFWKLHWLIEDNIGTDNMELVYSHYVNVTNLPFSISDTPLFYSFTYVGPLGRRNCLMYLDGVPYIYIQYLDGKYEDYNGTYKYTGNIPYELSEEYLKKMYIEWRKEQYVSMNQSEEIELKFDMYISDKYFTIENASDSANTARLVIKLKMDPLMVGIETKKWERLKGTYRFDVWDKDIYIIDLRYDGYNISTDFDLTYSFNVINEAFTGPEVMEVKAYNLNDVEVPVSYTITHPDNE